MAQHNDTFSQILLTCRDLLIRYLPKKLARVLIRAGEFSFLAHPIDFLPDIARKYPFAEKLPKSILKIISRFHPPIILTKIKGFKKIDGTNCEGFFVFCSLATRMMVLKRDLARKKIYQAAKFCEKLGGRYLGLGAFIPILTDAGSYLNDKVNMVLTNGSAFSAAIACQNVLKAVNIANIQERELTLSIVGAGGSVGSVCAHILSEYCHNFLLIDTNKEAINKLITKLGQQFPAVKYATYQDTSLLPSADVILVITNTPGTIVHSKHHPR